MDRTQILVGDVVKVIDTRCTYTSYGSWFNKNPDADKNNWAKNKIPFFRRKFKVIARGKHGMFRDCVVCAIKCRATGLVYLVDESGLEAWD